MKDKKKGGKKNHSLVLSTQAEKNVQPIQKRDLPNPTDEAQKLVSLINNRLMDEWDGKNVLIPFSVLGLGDDPLGDKTVEQLRKLYYTFEIKKVSSEEFETTCLEFK